jgi:hypothetical protein
VPKFDSFKTWHGIARFGKLTCHNNATYQIVTWLRLFCKYLSAIQLPSSYRDIYQYLQNSPCTLVIYKHATLFCNHFPLRATATQSRQRLKYNQMLPLRIRNGNISPAVLECVRYCGLSKVMSFPLQCWNASSNSVAAATMYLAGQIIEEGINKECNRFLLRGRRKNVMLWCPLEQMCLGKHISLRLIGTRYQGNRISN